MYQIKADNYEVQYHISSSFLSIMLTIGMRMIVCKVNQIITTAKHMQG